jgi:tRNA (guanine37-N1)-methyltransferase
VKASIITLFPESLTSILDASILGRAQKAGHLQVDAIDMRNYSNNKHRTVDDTPAGGGAGMLVRVDVVANAIKDLKSPAHVVLVDAAGKPFTQSDARRLSTKQHIAFVCGRYEGVDARSLNYVDEVLSLGDYVLTGGELAALVMLDATVRLLPGVLGNDASSVEESFSQPLLEHRHYTRPVEYEGRSIPPVLLSGNHADIAKARRKDALLRTARVRPDLFVQHKRSRADEKILDDKRVQALDS